MNLRFPLVWIELDWIAGIERTKSGRIIGGEEATPHEFSAIVGLGAIVETPDGYNYGYPNCAGETSRNELKGTPERKMFMVSQSP
jgi:hypothetical protein